MSIKPETPDWQSTANNIFVNYVLQTVPLAILYYDYLLTLGDEIENYWPPRRPLTLLSGFFLGTRYLTLVGFIPVVVAMVWGTVSVVSRCGPIQYYHTFLEIFLQVPVGTLCILRLYALYAKDCRLLLGLITSSVALGVFSIYFITTANIHPHNFFWSVAPLCDPSTTPHDGVQLAIAWSAVLAFDVIISALTAFRAFRVWNAGRIVHVLLRDGILYFCALSACNLVNIMIQVVATPLLKTTFASLTNVLSVTLISRLMLSLRSDTGRVVSPDDEDTELSVTPAVNLDTEIVISEPQIGTSQRSTARDESV